ncbi:hypothetical protein GDO81_027518 [Engystomops pustulosus]|uniref:Taste receptor type 2 n=2 Tax=Engystomops pustulosus TaxID=76066 RepID=A0AAV6YLR0_ENGPU|nr:hypothetical protein GDO81_027518 [Engystomops pustulosus]
MDDSTGDDTDVLYFVSSLTALVAGLVIHSFIIGVNVSDWWRGRSVTPVDHIVTSLGITRICTQSTITLYIILRAFYRRYLDIVFVILLIFNRIYDFFTYVNIWLTCLLSIVLCLKISNLHTRLFLYLRRMISHGTGPLIVASIISSAVSSLIILFAITEVNYGKIYNKTTDNQLTDCIEVHSLYLYTIGTFFPLLFYCTSSVLLFVSLYHHTTRMKMSSNLSINLETYYSAMRFVAFTFTYNTVYLAGHFTTALYFYLNCVILTWLSIVLEFLPALHSSYLIYRTAKLRSQMSKVLQGVMDFFLPRKDEETRENIEIVIM